MPDNTWTTQKNRVKMQRTTRLSLAAASDPSGDKPTWGGFAHPLY